MCEFCTKHGEGKKWYEVMENYSAEFLAVSSRQEYINHFVPNVRNHAEANIKKLIWAKKRLPFAYRFIRSIGARRMKKKHYGQVIPLEDAENIVDLVHSVTRVPCICRNVATGDHNARYCLLLGIDPTGLVLDWPEIKSSLEALTASEAKLLLQDFDKEGLVHSVWTFETPFIGAICNCDYDCLAYRIQVKEDLLNMMFKGEYVGVIDPDLCAGCKRCVKLCQFDSVEYSPATKKCSINPVKCYGCGVCRSGCKKEAISLLDKAGFPHLPF